MLLALLRGGLSHWHSGVQSLEVRRAALGRVARDRQKFLFQVLRSAATLAMSESGNGSFVFDSLVSFFIRCFPPLPLVSLLCGKCTAFWEGNYYSSFLHFGLLFDVNIVLFCTILVLLNLRFI